jgi:hypothetical protein
MLMTLAFDVFISARLSGVRVLPAAVEVVGIGQCSQASLMRIATWRLH